MSVEYKAGIAYGYYLNEEETNTLRDSDAFYEEAVEDFYIDLNFWTGESGSVFGYNLAAANETMPCIALDDIVINDSLTEEVIVAYEKYLKPLFGERQPKKLSYFQIY